MSSFARASSSARDALHHAAQLVEQHPERLGGLVHLRCAGDHERRRRLAHVEARSHAGRVVAQRRVPVRAQSVADDGGQDLHRKEIGIRVRPAHAADENPRLRRARHVDRASAGAQPSEGPAPVRRRDSHSPAAICRSAFPAMAAPDPAPRPQPRSRCCCPVGTRPRERRGDPRVSTPGCSRPSRSAARRCGATDRSCRGRTPAPRSRPDRRARCAA